MGRAVDLREAAMKRNNGRLDVCGLCGKPLKNKVRLELDQRNDTYHDFGDVPPNCSQGGFFFGADCAARLRGEARAARVAK